MITKFLFYFKQNWINGQKWFIWCQQQYFRHRLNSILIWVVCYLFWEEIPNIGRVLAPYSYWFQRSQQSLYFINSKALMLYWRGPIANPGRSMTTNNTTSSLILITNIMFTRGQDSERFQLIEGFEMESRLSQEMNLTFLYNSSDSYFYVVKCSFVLFFVKYLNCIMQSMFFNIYANKLINLYCIYSSFHFEASNSI